VIWDHKEIRDFIQSENLISLNEGNTAENKFLHNGVEVIIKREDLNPSGSWKDRGTAFKLTELFKNNVNQAVISSSGNAAISYLTYLKSFKDFKLHVVVSKSVNQAKLSKINELINNTHHELHISDNPKKLSVELSARYNCTNLRSSIDESIIKGYWSLGFELKKNILPDREIALISPVSSGTAFVGLTQGLQMRLVNDWQLPKMYAAQTSQVNPIVRQLGVSVESEVSVADSIIDSTALRSPQILKILNETNGSAFAISNLEIDQARDFIKEKADLVLSNTSLLSVATYLRLVKENVKLDRAILIASGT
jgi:threonine synthase